MFGDIFLFCAIMVASMLIRPTLYRLDLGRFKVILHVFDFIGMVVHEVSHAIICILCRVPVKDIKFAWRDEKSGQVGIHGYVSIDTRKDNFLKDFCISFAPVFISTWLFIACLKLAFNPLLPYVLQIMLAFTCISLVLGASPSFVDMRGVVAAFFDDIRHSLYQLSLVILSVVSVIVLVVIFRVIIFDFLYLFAIVLGYFIYKYVFMGVSIGISNLFRHRHLRVKDKIDMNAYTRRTHRPLVPEKMGIEEAHW